MKQQNPPSHSKAAKRRRSKRHNYCFPFSPRLLRDFSRKSDSTTPQGSWRSCSFPGCTHKVHSSCQPALPTFREAPSTLQDFSAAASKRQSSFSWIPSSGCHLWQTSHIYVLPCHIWVAKKWQSIDAVTSRWDMFFLFSVLRLRFPFNT